MGNSTYVRLLARMVVSNSGPALPPSALSPPPVPLRRLRRRLISTAALSREFGAYRKTVRLYLVQGPFAVLRDGSLPVSLLSPPAPPAPLRLLPAAARGDGEVRAGEVLPAEGVHRGRQVGRIEIGGHFLVVTAPRRMHNLHIPLLVMQEELQDGLRREGPSGAPAAGEPFISHARASACHAQVLTLAGLLLRLHQRDGRLSAHPHPPLRRGEVRAAAQRGGAGRRQRRKEPAERGLLPVLKKRSMQEQKKLYRECTSPLRWHF